MTSDDRKLLITKDGSYTIEQPSMGVTFHSHYGAVQESRHVFIREGLQHLLAQNSIDKVSIFEMGFGTGLNALLTYFEAAARQMKVHYTSLDLYPLSTDLIDALHYNIGEADDQKVLKELHAADWNREVLIGAHFNLLKKREDLLNFIPKNKVDLIYFDAFGPGTQPELWSTQVFTKMFEMLNADGVFVTYSSKGDVRRALQASGFRVEKLQGPPGKREMVRAFKQ